ncbi:MAG: HAMP domain-containing protein, partial [Actinomycetota bacterium]|nr:HAMP domain-containing protein [Actinomycetota bacterium]
MPRDLHLSTRITLGALVVIVAVTLLMLTLQESFLRKQYHVEREAQIGEVLHTEKSHVKQTINTLRQDVLFLSNTPPVSGIIRAHENKGYDARDKNPLERWERRLQEIFTAFSRAHPDYYRIRYVGVADGGRELVRMDNRDGKVGVTAPHLLRPLANEAFFRSAQKLLPGQIGLSKFELDRDSGTSAANFSFGLHAVTPVYSDNGKLFGMMILTLDARAILQSAMHGLPGGAKTLIADESGHYLMRQEVNGGTVFSENEAGLITAEIPELSALFDRDTDDYFPLSPIRSTVGDQYVAAERVHFDPLDPERFLLIAYSMPGNGRGGLATSWQTLLVALFGMLAVGGILSAMLKRAFAPLESLAQRASEMAAGNCALHMPPASGEIGHLSSALNVMLDQLSLRE